MQIHDLNFEPYISAEAIRKQTDRVAQEINRDFTNAARTPLIIITLGGGAIFGADLVRKLDFPAEIAFVKCSSYHASTESSGTIVFELEPTLCVTHRDVIVIEDIVDTGNTYEALHSYLLRKEASSVRIATMLIKPEVYKKDLPIDYSGMEIDNIFVVGLGLDYNQLGRNLDGIYRLSK